MVIYTYIFSFENHQKKRVIRKSVWKRDVIHKTLKRNSRKISWFYCLTKWIPFFSNLNLVFGLNKNIFKYHKCTKQIHFILYNTLNSSSLVKFCYPDMLTTYKSPKRPLWSRNGLIKLETLTWSWRSLCAAAKKLLPSLRRVCTSQE